MVIGESLAQALADDDADIFRGVVEIYVQIALGPHLQVEQPMAGQCRQHMVQKANASGDIRAPFAVEAKGDGDRGFRSLAADFRAAVPGRGGLHAA